MIKVILKKHQDLCNDFFLFPGSHSLTVSFLLWYSLAVILNSIVSCSNFICDIHCSPF